MSCGINHAPDYDGLGVIEFHGKVLTRLDESRSPNWAEYCVSCGRLIAATDKFMMMYGYPDYGPERVATVGLLWCHHFYKDEPQKVYKFDNIYQRIFSNYDHPCLCEDCIKELTELGWSFCECGCGG